ncbi:MAG TPA: hypothetical protein VLM79_24025 [Kofleriaceae bacterium]|nr:hypothetical protein [Kofleriaceae bacterium]
MPPTTSPAPSRSAMPRPWAWVRTTWPRSRTSTGLPPGSVATSADAMSSGVVAAPRPRTTCSCSAISSVRPPISRLAPRTARATSSTPRPCAASLPASIRTSIWRSMPPSDATSATPGTLSSA